MTVQTRDSAEHTEGPWTVWQDHRPGMSYNRHVVANGGETTICFLSHSNGKDPAKDRRRANLIAAAPDLLSALRDVVNSHGQRDGLDDDELLPADRQSPQIAAAMAAISLAEFGSFPSGDRT